MTAGADGVVLELQDVARVHPHPAGPVDVLRGVDLALRRGEVALVRGPSGSGKSTLLAVAGTLDRPTRGRVRLMGRDVTGAREAERARIRRAHVGFVLQDAGLIASLGVLDNLRLAAALTRTPVTEARLLEDLARVGLAERARHHPDELSLGQAQRVAIARACLHEPALLLADEPTGNLDEEASAVVARLLRTLADERGTAVLLATHDLALGPWAHARYVLARGRLERDA